MLIAETKNCSDVLEFEIEEAIETYELPIILAFTGVEVVKSVTTYQLALLPKLLQNKINQSRAKILFIPFKLNAIKRAISDFNVHTVGLENKLYTYKQMETWNK